MNLLDALVIVAAVVAMLGGWRLGFIHRVTGWIGFFGGAVLGAHLASWLFTPPSHPDSLALVRTLGMVVVGASAGQMLGSLVGQRIRPRSAGSALMKVDRLAGLGIAVVGVMVTVWMVIPSMSQIEGWPSRQGRGSAIGSAMLRLLGEPPDVLAGVERSLGISGLTTMLNDLASIPKARDAPANSPVPARVLAVVRRSVIKLTGPACSRVQSGSGVVIAPGLVATNAHVVAGTERVTATTDDGRSFEGVVVYLDPAQDIAYVRVASLDRPALPTMPASALGLGVVLGYPNGGPMAVQPYAIAGVQRAATRDIYDEKAVERRVVVIGSRIGPGDSGGPLIDVSGKVVGLAFGVSPTEAATAYAIPVSELPAPSRVLRAGGVPTGRCRT